MERPEISQLDPALLRKLVEASQSVTAELSLSSALQKIVDAAVDLTSCKYGALGVLGPSGKIEEFITHGVSDEQRTAIGDPPVGLGILGKLIREPHPLKIDELALHPDSVGFPPNHPPMSTFLGAPIRVRDRVYGNIYLTEKFGGSFTDDDLALLELFAAQAAIVIENATLYEESESRGERLGQLAERLGREADLLAARLAELEAFQSISLMVAGEERTDEVLRTVADAARRLFAAKSSGVALVDADGSMTLVATSGAVEAASVGMVLDTKGCWGRVAVSGEPEIIFDTAEAGDASLGGFGARSAMVVPCRSGRELVGVLAVMAGTTSAFDKGRLDLALPLAALAASAVTLRRRLAESVVHDERERIAMELHDGVIQQLFATGLGLESAKAMIESDPEGAVRQITSAISEIDHCVSEIRMHINMLSNPDTASLRERLARLAAREHTYPIDIVFETEPGAPDLPASDSRTGELVSFVREGLSNVVRHARASGARIIVGGDEQLLLLSVIDDGVGFDPEVGGGRGISNFQERARRLGGELEIDSSPGRTEVRIAVPLSAGSSPVRSADGSGEK